MNANGNKEVYFFQKTNFSNKKKQQEKLFFRNCKI
jgi:hypothetical protein